MCFYLNKKATKFDVDHWFYNHRFMWSEGCLLDNPYRTTKAIFFFFFCLLIFSVIIDWSTQLKKFSMIVMLYNVSFALLEVFCFFKYQRLHWRSHPLKPYFILFILFGTELVFNIHGYLRKMGQSVFFFFFLFALHCDSIGSRECPCLSVFALHVTHARQFLAWIVGPFISWCVVISMFI